jgi:hypothetical protein
MAKTAAQEKWVTGRWRGQNAYTHASEVKIIYPGGRVETRPRLPPGLLDRGHGVRVETEAGAILSELSETYFTPHPE